MIMVFVVCLKNPAVFVVCPAVFVVCLKTPTVVKNPTEKLKNISAKQRKDVINNNINYLLVYIIIYLFFYKPKQ